MGNYMYCCHPMFHDDDEPKHILRRFDSQTNVQTKQLPVQQQQQPIQQVAKEPQVKEQPQQVLSPPPKDWELCEVEMPSSPLPNDVKEERGLRRYDAASPL